MLSSRFGRVNRLITRYRQATRRRPVRHRPMCRRPMCHRPTRCRTRPILATVRSIRNFSGRTAPPDRD